jgi:type IX secretion system PorP/SprF family membrane protein
MKQLFTLLIVAATVSVTFAQQDAEYTMYRFNGLYLNPAYAGSREVISATAIYRHQWVNVPKAPRSASVAIHSPLRNNNVALGLIYSYDQLGVTKTNTVTADFAYRIPLGKKKKVKLSIGINAGAINYQANLNDVKTQTANDPNFAGNNQNRWLPVVGAGIYAYSEKFFVGVSVPNILQSSLDDKYNVFETSTSVARRYTHLLATAGYVFNLGKKVKFMPSILMKYVPKHAPIDFDFNANFVFIDRIWLGAGYRLQDSYSFMAAFNITRQLRVGYSYDLTASKFSGYNAGTHEVMLGFDCDFKGKKIVNPRFVKYF